MYSLLIVLVTLAGSVGASQTFGSLAGVVVDPLNAVLPNARVTMVQPERNARYEVRTDRSGQFEFVGLPAGDYQLEAETAGFQTYRAAVSVAGNAQQRTVMLQIGRLHETIRIVESDAPPDLPKPPISYREPPCPAKAGATIVGGNLKPPVKLRDVKPVYPASFRGSGRDAVIVMDGHIGLDGYLKDLQAKQPADPAFVEALMPALREWQFSSTLLNCVPQEVEITITAAFEHR